jgi:hypothetical protein
MKPEAEKSASFLLRGWGAGSRTVRILQEASRANVADMGHDEAFRAVDSLLPPASALQLGPEGCLTITVPGEDQVSVSQEMLDETFYHHLLGQEVMCS